jgi:hypothetical protein
MVIDAEGHRWVVYRQLERYYMTDGVYQEEIVNPHEWQELMTEAYRLSSDEFMACDLACERLRYLMEPLGDWNELA